MEWNLQDKGDDNLMSWKHSRIFSRFCACLTLAFFSTACTNSSSAPTRARANTPQVTPVTVATALREDLPVYLDGLGSIEAYYTDNVKSRVDGQLVEVKFKEGEYVKQGALLAVIDPRPYQVQLEQAQAQLFKDQASLRDAQLNYQRYKDLLQNSGAMSQQQVDTQQATVDQLQGTVRNDQAMVDSAKLNLVYCNITAPISGRIGLRQVDPGNIVHAADANAMFVITQMQPITAVFTLPEDQLPEVAKHQRQAPLQVDAYSRDDSTKLASGKLLTIDNQIDPTTGTGKLKAVFSNEDSVLWPNQFVNIHLLLDTAKNATVIPSAAVLQGPQGSYVYVVKPDNTVVATTVNVAISEGLQTAIASGIAPNDVVVTDGQDKLQNGSKVEPHQQPASGNSQNAAPGDANGKGGSGRHGGANSRASNSTNPQPATGGRGHRPGSQATPSSNTGTPQQ